ncbi:hypothetical protein EN35_32775 [Rhodococcus qingshengii]|nr:hypothetical protein EN35_32775 [Rhodococcus qingshengii]
MTRAVLAVMGHENSTVLQGDYTRADFPEIEGTTAFLGNPPYVRHHQIEPAVKEWAQSAAKQEVLQSVD